MRIYYWRERPNFGDQLAPYLLKRFVGVEAEWSPPDSAEVITIGSLLSHIPSTYRGKILGTGLLYRDYVPDLPLAKVLGVRGPLTAKYFKDDVAIGDPGLLANELVSHEERTIDLGLVPHWTDDKLAKDSQFIGKWTRTVIDITANPLEIVRAMSRCRKIVTSSLHGAVVADALRIPRRIELASAITHSPYEGGTFKFEDYHASIGLPFRIGEVQRPNHHIVHDRQSEVFDMYRSLKYV